MTVKYNKQRPLTKKEKREIERIQQALGINNQTQNN